MEIARLTVVVKIGALILFAQSLTAEAAEVILKIADPLTAVIKGLGPQFESDTGHKLIAKRLIVASIHRLAQGPLNEAAVLPIAG